MLDAFRPVNIINRLFTHSIEIYVAIIPITVLIRRSVQKNGFLASSFHLNRIFNRNTSHQTDLITSFAQHFIIFCIMTSLFITCAFCSNHPSTSTPSSRLAAHTFGAPDSSAIMMRDRLSSLEKFNEKEIARNAEGMTSGIAEDRVPIKETRANRLEILKHELEQEQKQQEEQQKKEEEQQQQSSAQQQQNKRLRKNRREVALSRQHDELVPTNTPKHNKLLTHKTASSFIDRKDKLASLRSESNFMPNIYGKISQLTLPEGDRASTLYGLKRGFLPSENGFAFGAGTESLIIKSTSATRDSRSSSTLSEGKFFPTREELSSATTDITLPTLDNSNIQTTTSQSPNHSQQHSGFTPCENNGTYINGKCRCYFPYTGERCVDYACEHGLSVGPRYDPESTFFNRKCICDEDWAGEFCNIPIADQCNERGQYIRGRCKCHGYYFGPKCQYVGKCVNGKLQEGVCVCNYGYEGDYCDKIVCHHGYPDRSNHSNSCVCPPRHAGMFCDECVITGDYILPFPNCTEERIPHRARLSRQKTNDRIMARVIIIGVASFLLAVLLIAMFVMHWGRKRAQQYDANGLAREQQREQMEERKKLLEHVIYIQALRRDSARDAPFIPCVSDSVIGYLRPNRRSSRFTDSKRFDHDIL